MKKNSLIIAAVLVVTIMFLSASIQSNQLFAQDTGILTVQSKTSYDQTVKELKQLIAKNGMMVLSEIQQGKILSMTGLTLKAVSLFVGKPQVGKKLFSANRGVGIAVPIRLNIYKNTDGKTYINFVNPSFQLRSFKNKRIQKIAMMLDQKLAKLTKMISK